MTKTSWNVRHHFWLVNLTLGTRLVTSGRKRLLGYPGFSTIPKLHVNKLANTV